jgi:hypothetical protein
MTRGRRCITPGVDAAVWVSSGRWGPKRVRVSQCLALRAEDAYTCLLRENAARVRPGEQGSARWTVSDSSGESASFAADWELRANGVWRHGRLFFRRPKCSRLATRLYVPRVDMGAACRRCWGLTYESRQERNYKPRGSILGFLTLQMSAHWYTLTAREGRAEAAEKRYAERREILKAGCPCA